MSGIYNRYNRYIDNRWKLDGDKHKDASITDLEKKQFAYRIWREDFEKNQKREDGKESELKNYWREVYQLIGFDNVFQGVWFQGVTQLAAQRGCRFSAIPIILSVLVSLATIVGVYLKISKVQVLEKSLHWDRCSSKGLQSFISACEIEGVDFDFVATGAAADKSHLWMLIEFDKASKVAKIKRIILLVSLIIASILFAWLIYLIMCGKYV